MGRIADDVIERIRDAADLLEIVQESVQLKRTGSDWRGPCPFHGGTHRNFAVIPKKNCFYCFVCHESGDVFSWYRKKFGMDYPTAVREVARRYGIPIPEQGERSGPDPREPLFQACDAAQGWFATRLRESPDADAARRYLQDRGIPLDEAGQLGLGYAPRGQEFVNAMAQLGIAEPVLIEAALVMRREDGTTVPRFRNRLLFPIHDLRGRVVGFGGRILGAGEPKYLNSPETPVFHKGEQLYHMHIAKNAIRKAGYAILVEGYFDVQRLALAEIDHVVAPLGTALTEAQATLLKRYTNEAVLLYDSDAPGLRATFRTADILLAHGIRVRVGTMLPGEDPDTVVQKGGAAAIEVIIRDAIDVIERKLQLLEERGWFADVHRAREALDRLLPTVRAASDPLTRELYISRVAERLGVSREVVATEATAPAPRSVPAPSPQAPDRAPVQGRPATARAPGAEIERKLLRLLLLQPAWLERARTEVPSDRFTLRTYRRIYEALLALPPGAPVGDALSGLDDRARDAWARLAEAGWPASGYDADREYVGALQALEEIHAFPEIAAEPDPVTRQRRWNALSMEGQARYRLYLATAARPRSRAQSSPEE
jgi:DNA primase